MPKIQTEDILGLTAIFFAVVGFICSLIALLWTMFI